MVGTCLLDKQRIALGVLDFNFMGGSMGSVVGERLTRLIEHALQERLPLIVISASGGARMQESILSLMQMAKTSAALAKLHEAHLPYISVLTNPTTGGVTASFASLGDVIIAEPNALICFAGRESSSKQSGDSCHQGLKSRNFLLKHGMIDCIVNRHDLKKKLAELIDFLTGNSREETLPSLQTPRVEPRKVSLLLFRLKKILKLIDGETPMSHDRPSHPIDIPTLIEDEDLLPYYATDGAAGADAKAYLKGPLIIPAGRSALVPTGLRLAIPEGYEIQVRPRSGLALKHQVTVLNAPGTIDADYRGEIKILLMNHGSEDFTIMPGDRIAQLVLAPAFRPNFVICQDLTTTKRGIGGFGHTG